MRLKPGVGGLFLHDDQAGGGYEDGNRGSFTRTALQTLRVEDQRQQVAARNAADRRPDQRDTEPDISSINRVARRPC